MASKVKFPELADQGHRNIEVGGAPDGRAPESARALREREAAGAESAWAWRCT